LFVSVSPYETQTDICFLKKRLVIPQGKKNSIKIACMGVGDLGKKHNFNVFLKKSRKNGAKNTVLSSCASILNTSIRCIVNGQLHFLATAPHTP
jgi:hypothetical protein